MQIDVTGKNCPWRDFIYLKPVLRPMLMVRQSLANLAESDNQDDVSFSIEGWFLGLMDPPGMWIREVVDIKIDEEAVDFRPDHSVKLLYRIWLVSGTYTLSTINRQIGELRYSFNPEEHLKSEIIAHSRTFINKMIGIE